jgi:hypothetical protein
VDIVVCSQAAEPFGQPGDIQTDSLVHFSFPRFSGAPLKRLYDLAWLLSGGFLLLLPGS